MINNLPKSLIEAAEKVITESNEPKLKHIAEVKTNFPDADYYIVRKGSRDTVGKVTNEFSPEHIGVKITHEGVLPKYHQYAMQYAHMNGYWKPKAKGVLELQHISVDDVKNMPAIYKGLNESIVDTHIDVDGEFKHRYNSEGKLIHHTDDGIRNFHKWFKNSSFTDEHGRPLVMYHGSKSRVTMKMDSKGNPEKTPDGEFDLDYHGNDIHRFHSSTNGKLGSGVYLTSDRKEAENYTEGKGTIYPVYANGTHIRKEHTLGITNWTVHPHQIKSALGNNGKFFHVFNIHEEVEPENTRPFTTDEHGKHIVFDNDTYKISVNNPNDATYIALWHQGKKVGAMYTGNGRTSDTEGYSTIRSVDIDKKHQGQGMGKQMYRIALQYAHEKYKGIGSEQPDRINKKQVPAILKRLGGKEHESGDITIER